MAAEMRQPKPLHFLLLLATASLCALASTVSAGDGGGMPLVTAITKDAATSLYTAPLRDTRPLVLDLSGPIVWTTCDGPSHDTLDCSSDACMRAHRFQPPNCPQTGYGEPDARSRNRCKCTAHPHNPVSGDTASGDVTRVTLSANATDGKNPLYQVSFTAVASCAPDSLLAKLPAGAAGVAGLARSGLALPAQVADTQKVGNKFALCLPSAGSGAGVAIFCGGPLFLLPPGRPDVNATLAGYTPLRKHGESPGYYISADKGIAVNQARLQLDDGYGAPLVLGLCSTIPYTALRPDVYRAFIKAFDTATAGRARITPAVAPFELCYNSTELGSTRLGYAVPQIDLMLEGGRNWTVFGGNSMVQVNDNTACLAFVEMKQEEVDKHGGLPAAVIGGFQMENNLLVFDEEKQRLGFSSLLWGRQTTCSNFNFTMAA
ncbi:chitinase CLP-like [Triticum urartu]|uniref:Peptidase A1 domain-containing protein n=1 Tax=Triticum urartu TaxID=4572 RepID=A0A8R7PX30_TRIUA|nr:chitinase CLP-like [Triticum urartu]